jgi:hypothetical protein
VAIPTLVCHRILKDRTESLVFEMEEHSMKIIEILEGTGTVGGKIGPETGAVDGAASAPRER